MGDDDAYYDDNVLVSDLADDDEGAFDCTACGKWIVGQVPIIIWNDYGNGQVDEVARLCHPCGAALVSLRPATADEVREWQESRRTAPGGGT